MKEHVKKEHKKNLHEKALEHQCFVWAEFVSVVDSIPPKPILMGKAQKLCKNSNHAEGGPMYAQT